MKLSAWIRRGACLGGLSLVMASASLAASPPALASDLGTNLYLIGPQTVFGPASCELPTNTSVVFSQSGTSQVVTVTINGTTLPPVSVFDNGRGVSQVIDGCTAYYNALALGNVPGQELPAVWIGYHPATTCLIGVGGCQAQLPFNPGDTSSIRSVGIGVLCNTPLPSSGQPHCFASAQEPLH